MKNTLLGSVAAIALSTSAFAADLPRRAAPVAPAPVATFTWTGAYVGLSAGYINNSTRAFGIDEMPVEELPYLSLPSRSGRAGGGLAGVTLGYNFQNGAFVYGLEADFSVANAAFEKTVRDDAYIESQVTSFGTLRARIGFAIQPRTILYATGGLAFAGLKSTYAVDTDGDHCRSGFSGMKAGWTGGVGFEHALNNNLSVKVEGLYYDLGKKNGNADGGCCRSGFKNTGFVGRVGVNFKF